MIGRALAGLVALACAVAGAWLCWHHPLSASVALALFGLGALAMARWPWAWPVVLPALLPWLALAPWSGWITVEETDLLVLAVAAGSYARWALRPLPGDRAIDVGVPLALLLLAAWTISVLIGLQRGIADAGGAAFGWYEAYRGPMNAWRLAKPTLAVWLLLPLWIRLEATPGARATDRLTLGLALCHGAAALACVYERAAFPGLLDFSSDYRTTGPFWEMHVGGAGLDACLAMTFPFAWRQWSIARSRWASVLSLGLLLMGVYAVLTTFSRILLLALPLGVVTLLWVQRRSLGFMPLAPAGAAARSILRRQQATVGALCAVVSVVGAWLFVGAGYRGLLALLGTAALLLVLVPKTVALGRRDWLGALALAVALGPVYVFGATLLPKGPYLAFGLVLAVSGVLLLAMGRQLGTALAIAGYWVAVACLGLVAGHWGGDRGLHTAWPAMVAMALALPLLAAPWAEPWPQPWPDSLRWQGGAWALLGVSAMVTALFFGGAYMSGRVSASDSDRQGRLSHWQTSLAMVQGDTARWLGTGLGRFLDHYALTAAPGHRPGDLRLVDADGRPAMWLSTGTHTQGWGELLRLSQRIDRPQGPLTLRVTVRGAAGTSVHAEVCVKHLLYDSGCQVVDAGLPVVAATAAGAARPGASAAAVAPALAPPSSPPWQTLPFTMPAAQSQAGPGWTRPRTPVFSLSSENATQGMTVREVSLVDSRGTELIANGRFDEGGARWFFSSDRHHMPWHAKSLVIHLLFEQGWLGLVTLSAMTLAALGVAFGRARRLPLAPPLAAALVGAWTVGLIDSLIDMPRLTLLLLLLTTIAIAQRPARPA